MEYLLEILELLETADDILSYSSLILCLTDDLGTSLKDEMARGDNPRLIQCYMHENGATEEEAREHMKALINDKWMKLNKEREATIRRRLDRRRPSFIIRRPPSDVALFKMILYIHNTTFQSDLHPDTQEEQAPNSFAKQYYEMLEADDEPLYEGCKKFSTLEAATRLLNWKAECNVPEATYNQALSLFKDVLPDDSNKMVHPSDGKAWKHFDSTHPTFSKEIRNVRLRLCTDGFNPNNSNSNPYSLWHLFLTIYNLPPWMSLKDVHVKLSLVIPGRKNPGHNLDVFLQPLIKELKTLWNDGVETYDAYRKHNFNMKATLLWTVSDFPAYAMLSGWSTHGKLACPYCMGNVDSFQLHNGGKPCWFDCHRRFLPTRHPYRRDRKGFLAQKYVFAGPPPQLTGTEIWQQIRHLPTIYEGEPYRPKNKKIDGFGQTHKWIKRSIFWELPYWHTLLIRHNLDLMHIEKNFFENLFYTIMGSLKTKDNVKARKDVELYCDRPELHMFNVQNTDMKPKASYTLNKMQLHKVCEWMTKLKFSDGNGGRGRGISRNIGIGGGSSSNVSGFSNQEDANCDNGSKSGGRGRGISRNIGIGGSSSNVSGFGNQEDANCDNGSRSEERGRGISRNIGIGGSSSNVSGFDYDNGSRSGGRGRGINGNIGGRGSCSTSGFGNPDVDFDTNDNETETKTSQHNLTLPVILSVFSKLCFMVLGQRRERLTKKAETTCLRNFRIYINGTRRKVQLCIRLGKGWCRVVGNDLSVLKPYTPSWIDQAHWDNMIARLWNTSRWKKKSNVARQNRLTKVDGEVSKHTAGFKTILQHKFQIEKEKKQPVSLLEAYHRTHTSTNVSSEASGSEMDEASEGRTREYVTDSSKRLADAVEAAIMEKHGPDVSEHPPNHFDLCGEATEGRKKGKLVGLGTRGDQRVMVTCTAATSSSSSTSNEQVQTLEEIIRRLQEENPQIRSQNQREMQIKIQRQVEQQVLEHMQQRELEANAREQAREREWQQRMNDINSVLRKFTDSRPPP
nr:hypothetical protein [Tanacetum cinerariifolium]